MSFWDELAKLGGASDETERAPAAPEVAAPVPVLQEAPAPVSQVPDGVEELTAAGLMGDIAKPRNVQVKVPQVDIASYDTKTDNSARQNEFKSSLEALKEQYAAAQEDARSRQMKQEMLAALSNNIGNIVGGAQAMNTKASVTPVQTKAMPVQDHMGRVDRNHKMNYEGLLKQYKDLQEGGLTAKDKMYADISNKQMQMQGLRAELNADNQDRNIGMRYGGTALKEQEGNELSNKQLEGLKDLDTNLSSMSKIIAGAEKFKDKLGPNASDFEAAKEGRIGGAIRAVSPIDKEFVEYRHTLKSTKAAYQKMLSGLTLTPAEMQEMQGYIPNEKMPYDSLVANSKAFERRVKELRDREVASLEKYQGKNARGYSKPNEPKAPASSGPLGETTERNGKKYKWNATAGKYQLAQ